MKTNFLLLFYLFGFSSFAQQLTIPETLDYINDKLYDNQIMAFGKNGEFFYIKLKNNDFWKNGSSIQEVLKSIRKDSYIISSADFKRMTFNEMIHSHIQDFELDKIKFETQGSFGSNENSGYISLKCITPDCFTRYGTTLFDNVKEDEVVKSFEDNIEVYKNQRYSDKVALKNALLYFLSIAQAKTEYQKFDSDPFSDNNYFPSKASIPNSSKTEEIISLKNSNGVYFINIEIGNQSLNFVLDSGASDVALSLQVERDLIRDGEITREDYLEPALYKLADGRIVSCRRVKLKEMKIGEIIVKNVTASIGVSETPLLLGRSFLDNFKSWTIDNKSNSLTLSL